MSLELAVLVGDESSGDVVSVSGSRQPPLSERAKISIAEITGYLIFALFIADFIIACWQNRGRGQYDPLPYSGYLCCRYLG